MFSVMIRRNAKDIARLQTTENLISDTLVPDPTKVKMSSDIQIPTLVAAESTTPGPRNVRVKPPSALVTVLRLLKSLEAFPLPKAAQVAAAKRRSRLPMVLDLTITSKCNVLETPATRTSAATNVDTVVTSQPSALAPRDAVARMNAPTAAVKAANTAMTVALQTQMTASGAMTEDATDATLIPIPAIEGDQPTRRKATQRESTTRTTMPTIATRLILAVIMTTTMTIFMMTTSRDLMLPMTKKLTRLRKKRSSRMRLLRSLNEIGELINN